MSRSRENFFRWCFSLASTLGIFSPQLALADVLRKIQNDPEFVKLSGDNKFVIDLRYATANNFMSTNVYQEFNQCFLHKESAGKLYHAARSLKELKPGWRLVLFDCLRPRSIQWKLWEKVKDTPQQHYVADPVKGSLHNYGLAVDLSIVDENGKEADMGTSFDTFSELSQPKFEDRFFAEKKLTIEQLSNRHLLRKVMTEAGFLQLQTEWWHYDAVAREQLKHYKIVE